MFLLHVATSLLSCSSLNYCVMVSHVGYEMCCRASSTTSSLLKRHKTSQRHHFIAIFVLFLTMELPEQMSGQWQLGARRGASHCIDIDKHQSHKVIHMAPKSQLNSLPLLPLNVQAFPYVISPAASISTAPSQWFALHLSFLFFYSFNAHYSKPIILSQSDFLSRKWTCAFGQ